MQNDSTAKATVRYALRPVWGSTAAFALATSLLGLIAYRRWALGAPHILLLTLGYAGLALSILYVAWTLVALAAGWALPTTALIRWFSIAQWMCRNEPFLPYVLLACAGLGVVAAWLRPLFNLAPAEQAKEEAAFRAFSGAGACSSRHAPSHSRSAACGPDWYGRVISTASRLQG